MKKAREFMQTLGRLTKVIERASHDLEEAKTKQDRLGLLFVKMHQQRVLEARAELVELNKVLEIVTEDMDNKVKSNLLAFFVDGHSMNHIAEETYYTPSAVHKRIHRGLAYLQGALEAYEEHEGKTVI